MKIDLNKAYKYILISIIIAPLIAQACSTSPHVRRKRHYTSQTRQLQATRPHQFSNQHSPLQQQQYQNSEPFETSLVSLNQAELYHQLEQESSQMQQDISRRMAQDEWFAGLYTTTEVYEKVCELCRNLQKMGPEYPCGIGNKILQDAKKWVQFATRLSQVQFSFQPTQTTRQLLQQEDEIMPLQASSQEKLEIKRQFTDMLATLEIIQITSKHLAQKIIASKIYNEVLIFSSTHTTDDCLEHIKLTPEEYTVGKALLYSMKQEIEAHYLESKKTIK